MILQLFTYLLSAGLVVVGALSFIAALGIPGRFRSFLACVAACVPIAVGVWFFHSSGLHLNDLARLSEGAARELQGITQGLKETQSSRRQLNDLLNGKDLSMDSSPLPPRRRSP